MDWHLLPGKASNNAGIEIDDGQPSPGDTSVSPLSPATVGPCPTCRRIVTRAYDNHPDLPFWFHLAPRAGLCARHRQGEKASQ
jgi:hypothetical protein